MSSSGLLVAFAFASNDLSMSGKYSFSWLLIIGRMAIKIWTTILFITPPFGFFINLQLKYHNYKHNASIELIL